MYCTGCGSALAAGAKFCRDCGIGVQPQLQPDQTGGPTLSDLATIQQQHTHPQTRPMFKVLGWIVAVVVVLLGFSACLSPGTEGAADEDVELDVPVTVVSLRSVSPSVIEGVVEISNPAGRPLSDISCIAYAMVGGTDVTDGFFSSLLTVDGTRVPGETKTVGLSLPTHQGEAPYVDSLRITCENG